MAMSAINSSLSRLARRFEDNPGIREASDLYVDVANIAAIAAGTNSQVIFGRRGTGKTHTLLHLASKFQAAGNLPIYIDLRAIGSETSLYSDGQIDLAQRGTRLFLDIAGKLHSELLTALYNDTRRTEVFRDYDVPALLDALASAATEVSLSGPVSKTSTRRTESKQSDNASLNLRRDPALTLAAESAQTDESGYSVTRSGAENYTVKFGRLSTALSDIAEAWGEKKIVLLLDEWNSVPVDLQPFLADLLRRSIVPIRGIALKIAAVQHRSKFAIHANDGQYIGLELGADIFADINLDDYMSGFTRDLAREFFVTLLSKHVSAVLERDNQMKLFQDEREFQSACFKTAKAFEEFVLSAEGLPRDGISIIALAAQIAADKKIGVNDVRDAALRWHEENKLARLDSKTGARELLEYLMDEVIGKKNTRGFIVTQAETRSNSLLQLLLDDRLIHLVRRGISSRDHAGVRFDAYVLDFGFYVTLRATRKQPLPLQITGTDGELVDLREVPGADYRSVRAALLDFEEFRNRDNGPQEPTLAKPATELKGQIALDGLET